jgi:hypothetical protein
MTEGPWAAMAARTRRLNLLRQRKNDMISAVVNDVSDTIQRSLSDPQVITLLVVAAVLVFTHAGDIDNGPLKDLFPKDSKNSLVLWVRANVNKFFGMVVFAPAVFAVPNVHRATVALGAFAWIVIVPESSQAEYILQAILLALYFRVRGRNTKVAIVLFGLLLYFGGYLFTPKGSTTERTTPPKSRADPLKILVEKHREGAAAHPSGLPHGGDSSSHAYSSSTSESSERVVPTAIHPASPEIPPPTPKA